MKHHKILPLVLAASLLAACQSSLPERPAQPFAQDESGNVVITYEDVSIPLAVIHDGSSVFANMLLRPTAPPSSFSPGQVRDYWIGGVAEGMSRCGYFDDAIRLRKLAGDTSAFDRGRNKLKGERMANCRYVVDLYYRVRASYPDY